MCVELLTPDGNWSSYPPHKHDDSPECPVNNEEIYYFRIGRAETLADGFGLHRLYTSDGQIDETVEVRDGDVFLIPRGYHGPCVAAPGYTMYYLNVLAGSGPGPFDGLLRRPCAPLGARLVGGDGDRPSLSDDERREESLVAETVVLYLDRDLPADMLAAPGERAAAGAARLVGRRQRPWPRADGIVAGAPAGTVPGWIGARGRGSCSRSGIGYDNVDVAAATARGVAVCIAPDAPTVSTAEHAVALLLAAAKCLVGEPGAAAGRERRLLRGLPQRRAGREHARARRVRPHRPPGGPGWRPRST